MQKFRKVLFWCHLAVGVTGGVIIFLMSVTGVLLTYERQMSDWADTSTYAVERRDRTSRLGVEALAARVRETTGHSAARVTLHADPSAPAEIGFDGAASVYVDPFTGAVLGAGSARTTAFFRFVTDLHRWLAAWGQGRNTGRALTGAANLGFLFIVLSGLYLWWPRTWTPRHVRSVAWFRRGLSGKARDFNWHNVIGLWMWVPLVLVVASGVVISYPWAGNLVYRVVGEEPPAPRGPGGPPPAADAPPVVAPTDGLDALWARAEQQTPGWRSISLQLPKSLDAPVSFSIDEGDGGQPQKRASLALDRTTGEVVRWEPFSSFTTGRQLRVFFRFAHTGEYFGVAGQTIAGVASAGAAVLAWTGIALAWRRWRAWIARRRGRAADLPVV
ncbi:MAG: PepSY domain-containing protein [Blastocatellia bacterium]|nr:PepSY domain-containing protein [Blastocatellia bacterium]